MKFQACFAFVLVVAVATLTTQLVVGGPDSCIDTLPISKTRGDNLCYTATPPYANAGGWCLHRDAGEAFGCMCAETNSNGYNGSMNVLPPCSGKPIDPCVGSTTTVSACAKGPAQCKFNLDFQQYRCAPTTSRMGDCTYPRYGLYRTDHGYGCMCPSKNSDGVTGNDQLPDPCPADTPVDPCIGSTSSLSACAGGRTNCKWNYSQNKWLCMVSGTAAKYGACAYMDASNHLVQKACAAGTYCYKGNDYYSQCI